MKRFSDATTDGLDAGDIDKADSNVSRIVKHPSATHIILHWTDFNVSKAARKLVANTIHYVQ